MALFIDGLTFTDFARTVQVPGYPFPVQLKPFQVLWWVSLTPPQQHQLPPGTPWLPALFDTGNNFTLSLREEHVKQAGPGLILAWSGSPLYVRDGSGIVRTVPRLLVDIWLHSNLPHLAGQPYPLRLGPLGVAYYPSTGAAKGPPLPLLGLAALWTGSLKLEIDCHPGGGIVRLHTP
jgi:hypothetical protein